jgi:hypothetical protein
VRRFFRLRAVVLVCRFDDIGDELESGDVGPQRLERFRIGSLQTPHVFAMTPEELRVTWSIGERERLIRTFVDGRVELADDIAQDRLRDDE